MGNTNGRVLGLRAMGMAVVFLAPILGSCQQNLFTDSDPYTESRLQRYWGNDSAQATSESRKQSSEMGFGMPGGAASQ